MKSIYKLIKTSGYTLSITFIISVIFMSETSYAWVKIETHVLSLKTYKCMKCHKNIKNDKVFFPLKKPHAQINVKHFTGAKNCFRCHNKKNRDQLILINGKSIPFEKSYLVCTQCHGEKAREWRKNIHGKQIGSWKVSANTITSRLSCLSCHDPHDPKFKDMKALPPPLNPYVLRNRKNILNNSIHKEKDASVNQKKH